MNNPPFDWHHHSKPHGCEQPKNSGIFATSGCEDSFLIAEPCSILCRKAQPQILCMKYRQIQRTPCVTMRFFIRPLPLTSVAEPQFSVYISIQKAKMHALDPSGNTRKERPTQPSHHTTPFCKTNSDLSLLYLHSGAFSCKFLTFYHNRTISINGHL